MDLKKRTIKAPQENSSLARKQNKAWLLIFNSGAEATDQEEERLEGGKEEVASIFPRKEAGKHRRLTITHPCGREKTYEKKRGKRRLFRRSKSQGKEH